MKSRAPAMLICLFLLPAVALAGDDSRDGVYIRFGLCSSPYLFDNFVLGLTLEPELERRDSLQPLKYGFSDGRNRLMDTQVEGLGEAAVGYSVKNYRLELMFSYLATGAEIWGWEIWQYADSTFATSDNLTIHTLSLNGYFDFLSKKGRIVPYIGYGAGVAFVDLPSRPYVVWHDGGGYVGDPIPTESGWPWPGPFEGSRQTDVSGSSFMYAFYGGVDYRIASDVYLGLRIGYVRVGEVEADLEPVWVNARGYQNWTVEINGLSHRTAVLTLRLLRL